MIQVDGNFCFKNINKYTNKEKFCQQIILNTACYYWCSRVKGLLHWCSQQDWLVYTNVISSVSVKLKLNSNISSCKLAFTPKVYSWLQNVVWEISNWNACMPHLKLQDSFKSVKLNFVIWVGMMFAKLLSWVSSSFFPLYFLKEQKDFSL